MFLRTCVVRAYVTWRLSPFSTTFDQISVFIDRLSRIHFKSKCYQTLGSRWESWIVLFYYEILWPYLDGKIVFKWPKNFQKSENFKFRRFTLFKMYCSFINIFMINILKKWFLVFYRSHWVLQDGSYQIKKYCS